VASVEISSRLSTILVLDSHEENLAALRILLESQGYIVLLTRSSTHALDILNRLPVDLVIMETGSPDAPRIDLCHRLRSNHRTELIPVIALSHVRSDECEIACIRSGADAFLTRPYNVEALFARVQALLRRKGVVDRLEESETVLLALARAVEQRDSVTAVHCERLAPLCVAMGMAMGLPDDDLLALRRGGYLHDIGKIGMPDSILFKRGSLNDEEWRLMKTHTIRGEEICRPVKCLTAVLPIIRSHHERWNGSGYPDGLAGQRIPLLPRILQFADIYDALTVTRSYKAPMTPANALRLLQEETDRGWRDPELMRLFLRLEHENLRSAAQR
jgi:putative two-component system response regulator